MHFAVAVALILAVEVYLLYVTPRLVLVPWLAGLLAVQTAVAASRGRRIAEELMRPPGPEQVAAAVADALFTTGMSPRGAEAVSVTVDDRGLACCAMVGVDDEVSEAFSTAVQQSLAPVTAPGYAVRRWVLNAPVAPRGGLHVAFGRLRPDSETWHSVPTALSATVEQAQAFGRAWDHWVGGEATVHRVSERPQNQSGHRALARTR